MPFHTSAISPISSEERDGDADGKVARRRPPPWRLVSRRTGRRTRAQSSRKDSPTTAAPVARSP